MGGWVGGVGWTYPHALVAVGVGESAGGDGHPTNVETEGGTSETSLERVGGWVGGWVGWEWKGKGELGGSNELL